MPPQQCTYCARSFTRAEHLQRHVRSHTKEKPFKCGACGKGYAREDTLIRHTKSHCTGRIRMPPSHTSRNHGEITPIRGAGTPHGKIHADNNTDENTIMSTPSDMGNAGSTPCQANFDFGPNVWDFQSIGFMENTSLWNFEGEFIMNDIGLNGDSNQLPDLQLGIPDFADKIVPNSGQKPPTHAEGISPRIIDMRDIWFTGFQREDHLAIIPALPVRRNSMSMSVTSPSEPEIVDEDCRRQLSRALTHPPPQEDLLPSSRLLNLSVRRYLKCFHPIFPIIHAASFQPTVQNGLLLISMSSVGCLFVGSNDAIKRGRRIFEGLNKFILMSDKLIGHNSDQIVAVFQAATIGQTFAMLSGDPKHLAIFDSYHGSMLSFARREHMFDARPQMKPPIATSEDELERAWKEWIRREELRRIVLALYIHDAELSFLYQRDSLLKHRRSENETLTTSRAFAATSAKDWAEILTADHEQPATGSVCHSHPRDAFAAYIKLESIGVLISEDRRQGCLNDVTSKRYEDSLLRWYEGFSGLLRADQSDEFCLLSLWHWTFMNLLVDFDRLESAIGRDGPGETQESLEYVSSWASTPAASRCMMHAFLLQKRLEALRFNETAAIHVPRILFSAALASYCYIHYGPGNDGDSHPSASRFDMSHPEFQLLGSYIGHLSRLTRLTWSRAITSSITAATLCEINGFLQRVNEWGLAGRFRNIIARLIDGEA
ncbi:hypothetical protein BKA65DRAFT_397962 [Rhexocercosporidium sp. MPI-PUGE-AT-0058]|nr:hypothetical protein BKA65DRAFT_397962 [Rhexocercosporidium sp. MPI-PUGE-AT-0058]